MKRKRMHGRKRSPFCKTGDPSLEDYAKYPNVPKFGEWDRGTITETPSRWQKFKQKRRRNINILTDLVAPGVPQTKNLVNVTKEKLIKKKADQIKEKIK
tara:strand:- start:574 stop:870 length:297 start_codon:yes stop_codon:yes gene_type:complete